ncbi:MAG: hypothetical protein JNM75_12005 [Rhodospirillales bacterium]|nr:hypothetical protein [Rhodospirillales bacterium]
MTQQKQSVLFIETARQLGVDETGAEFERVFAQVASPKETGGAPRDLLNLSREPG